MANLTHEPSLRLEFPGAVYHLTARGDRREDIFHSSVPIVRTIMPTATLTSKGQITIPLAVENWTDRKFNRIRPSMTPKSVFKGRAFPDVAI